MEAVNEEFWYATVDIPVLRDKSVAAMTRFIFTIVCTFASGEHTPT